MNKTKTTQEEKYKSNIYSNEEEVHIYREKMSDHTTSKEIQTIIRKSKKRGSKKLILLVQKMAMNFIEEKEFLIKQLNDMSLKGVYSFNESETEVEIEKILVDDMKIKSDRLHYLTKLISRILDRLNFLNEIICQEDSQEMRIYGNIETPQKKIEIFDFKEEKLPYSAMKIHKRKEHGGLIRIIGKRVFKKRYDKLFTHTSKVQIITVDNYELLPRIPGTIVF